jgi:hypothetical protein
MLKSSNFRSLGGQPREGVVHGPNPCTPSSKSPPPSPHLSPPSPSSSLWGREAKGCPPPAMAAGGPRLPQRPLAYPPQGQEEGGRKGGGRGGREGGINEGKGGPGFHPAPPFSRPTLLHFWAGRQILQLV